MTRLRLLAACGLAVVLIAGLGAQDKKDPPAKGDAPKADAPKKDAPKGDAPKDSPKTEPKPADPVKTIDHQTTETVTPQAESRKAS